MKTYYTMRDVGKAKYVVSFHDGVKTHSDGSQFFDVRIFHNQKKLHAFIDGLKSEGYNEV